VAALLAACSAIALAQAPALTPPGGHPDKPRQVTVTAKIVEFQATKGVETGLSAYFERTASVDWYGRVHVPRQGIMSADVTFPASSAAGITVFLDRLRMTEGDIEMVLQALVDQNRATIISQPRVIVMRGGLPNTIKTTQKIPYESTRVVGATTVQVTQFRDTGVTLTVSVPDIVDLDGDWQTTDDMLVQLDIHAQVSEEGQRIVVALDDSLASGAFSFSNNAITAPEFISRSIKTKALVRNGQVLVLGGLYNSSRTRSLTTAPWLTQTEDLAVGLAERVVPGNFLASPLSSVLGNRSTTDSRRELVFMLKAEVWRPAYTIAEDGFGDDEDGRSPQDVLTDVIEGISDIPEGIRRRTAPREGVEAELGAEE
jgi:hypothetical protein